MSQGAQPEPEPEPEPAAEGGPPSSPAPAPVPSAHSADASTATDTDHSHVPQTASSVAPPEGNKWSCEVCTYENFPLSRKCTMCRATRPGAVGEDIFRLQDGASALPSQPSDHTDEIGAEAVCERLKPLRISTPPGTGQPSASTHVKWPCMTCTYENWPKSQKCAMCGAPAPTSPPPRPPAGINDVLNMGAAAEDRRTKRRNPDLLWLQACLGVVEGSLSAVEAYLRAGGDPARALAPHEVAILNRASAFDTGHTLVHLACRFQRQDILAALLDRISGAGPGLKRSPSYVAPDLAAAIRRHMASCMRQKKGNFPARYINEFCTFSLPAEIEELPSAIQEQLFSELLDREAQRTLEAEPLINWSAEITDTLGSRLYALWNRSAGDCLLDAVTQAAYGVFDRHNTLRHALADTLSHARTSFYTRWLAWERVEASLLQYAVDDQQLRAEWGRLLQHAAQPHAALHQLHVFALAHVMRRPIIVYGVNIVNSFRGEALGYARFQGIYLPLLWDAEFCSKSPLCLGYTRGHFSALVPMDSYSQRQYICGEEHDDSEDVAFLPLTDSEGKMLPVHFLTCEEMSSAEALVRVRMCCVGTRGGVLAARMQLRSRPLLVAQMTEEWLNHYRRLAQQTRGPFPPRLAGAADLSSDPDTDEE